MRDYYDYYYYYYYWSFLIWFLIFFRISLYKLYYHNCLLCPSLSSTLLIAINVKSFCYDYYTTAATKTRKIAIIIIIIITPFRVFHTGVSWWFLIKIWMTTSVFKSPGLYLSILTDLNNAIVWMVSTRPLISKSSSLSLFFFFCKLLQGFVVWSKLRSLFVSRNPREVCGSNSPGQILGCAYTICSHGLTSISCTIPNGSPCQCSRF